MIFEFSIFILGGCIGWGIALFMAGAFGVDEVCNKKGEENEY
jgi:hypothetical protein|tara:strand:- start:283 stop:408 length:126 start_codon:yes stop_codon:yes gene_type:complete